MVTPNTVQFPQLKAIDLHRVHNNTLHPYKVWGQRFTRFKPTLSTQNTLSVTAFASSSAAALSFE
jgi:hypothetical protein